MPNLPFDFFVHGTPHSVNSKNKIAKAAWRSLVRASVISEMVRKLQIAGAPADVAVRILYLPRAHKSLIDVDNIIKPILDALENLVYVNDHVVSQVLSRRTDRGLHGTIRPLYLSPTLVSALMTAGDVVYVSVDPAPNHSVTP
jgi:crossover junction endodeoxyribonuclease RusA